jgi:subtilisin family serine protease/surface antigen
VIFAFLVRIKRIQTPSVLLFVDTTEDLSQELEAEEPLDDFDIEDVESEIISDIVADEPSDGWSMQEEDTELLEAVADTVVAGEDGLKGADAPSPKDEQGVDDTPEDKVEQPETLDSGEDGESEEAVADEEVVASAEEEKSEETVADEEVAASVENEESEETIADEEEISSTEPLQSYEFTSGVFTVGDTGEVTIDFLFDGGGYRGELGIFSLDGMSDFKIGSEEFIQEAAERVLSNSVLGYVVISDQTEGAKFSGELGEGDSNSGEYLGAKTFIMRAGDRFGFMLVANGRVQQVFDNPGAEGALRPLFSMATANPEDAFHMGQIADVTGNGNTFVMEDLRVDTGSDRDYNDLIFQVRGATGTAIHLDEVIDPARDWRETDLGKEIVAYTEAEIVDTPDSEDEFSPLPEIVDTLPVDPLTNTEYIPGAVMLKFNSTATESEILAFAQSQGAVSLENIFEQETNDDGQWKVLYFSPDKDLVELRAVASQVSIVSGVELDYKLTINISRDPMANSLWGLHNTGQTGGLADADIDLPEAWRTQTGSKAVIVAVIDTGGDYRHPDLAANTWRNQREIFGNGIDDDRNGFVDDIHGYDFVNRDGDPMDDQGHGTHVAGTIGAVGNNNLGVVGVNQNVSLMHLKFLNSQGIGSTLDAVRAVDYATRMGADVINASFGGGPYSQAMFDAISRANNAGVLFVAAAGNESNNNDLRPSFPADYNLPNVISVAATDHRDRLAGFSNFGRNSVDIGAPGVNILSTLPGNRYGSFDGTSMAAPHVAGAAALLLAENSNQTPSQLKNLLMRTADPIASLQGKTVTGGRLNVNRALSQITPPKPRFPIWWVPFSGVVGPSVGINLRYSQSFSDRSPWNEPHGKRLEFDAWTYGETGTDMWLGTPDARWFKIKGRDLWVPSCWIYGNPPNSRPMPQSLNSFDPSATHGSLGDDFIATSNSTIREVPRFNGWVMSTVGANVRSGPSTTFSRVGFRNHRDTVTFDAWTYGERITDVQLGTPDERWYRIAGTTNQWIASALINGNAPGSTPLPRTQPITSPVNWNSPAYRQNNPLWRAGFAPRSVNPPIYSMSNPNAKGNCTWYANGRLRELGYSSTDLDRLVGNAADWDNQAQAAGIPISRTPTVGSIAQWESNHVAVVEQVNSDGTIVISESSYWPTSPHQFDYLYNRRTISTTNPSRYIHVRR